MMLLRNNETMPKSECTATNNSYQYTQHIHLYRHYIYTSSLILNAPQRVGSCTYTVTQNPTPQSVLTSTCRKKNLLAMAMKPSMEHDTCELQGVSHNKSHSFLQSTSGIIIQVTIPEDFICGLNVMCCLVALFVSDCNFDVDFVNESCKWFNSWHPKFDSTAYDPYPPQNLTCRTQFLPTCCDTWSAINCNARSPESA